jgi:hypothetical protein
VISASAFNNLAYRLVGFPAATDVHSGWHGEYADLRLLACDTLAPHEYRWRTLFTR